MSAGAWERGGPLLRERAVAVSERQAARTGCQASRSSGSPTILIADREGFYPASVPGHEQASRKGPGSPARVNTPPALPPGMQVVDRGRVRRCRRVSGRLHLCVRRLFHAGHPVQHWCAHCPSAWLSCFHAAPVRLCSLMCSCRPCLSCSALASGTMQCTH